MNKRIIGIICAVILVFCTIIGMLFFFINNKKDTSILELFYEVDFGMSNEELKEQVYYRFGRDNVEKGTVGERDYLKVEVNDFLGYEGIKCHVLYILMDNKLYDYGISASFEEGENKLKELSQMEDMVCDYLKEKAEDTKVLYDEIIVSSGDDWVDKYAIVGSDWFYIYRTEKSFRVYKTPFTDDEKKIILEEYK